MNEANHKRELVREIRLLGGQARRIEDNWAVGVLDLIIKLPGCPVFFAEGKIIHGNLFGPTPAQFAEGEKWIRVGVDAVLIGWRDSLMFVSPWVKQADKRECFGGGPDHAQALLEYMKVKNAKNQDSQSP